MAKLTPVQRIAIKRVILDFKRFWNAAPNSVDEDVIADKLIQYVDELAILMDEE